MEAGRHPEIGDLKRIRSLSEFSEGQLTSLSNKLEVLSAHKNETVIEHGCSENYCLYLLAGKLEATTRDNRATLFEGSEDGELLPIAKIRPSMYQVVARGPASYLKIWANQLTEFAQQMESDSGQMDVVKIEQSDEENALTIQLLKLATIVTPSQQWPDNR